MERARASGARDRGSSPLGGTFMKPEFQKLPHHLLIIPDGNRRWAQERNLKPADGHRAGVEVFRKITPLIFDLGIRYFTFWTSSQVNLLKRPKEESNFLIQLIKEELENLEREKFVKEKQICINIFGNWQDILPKNIEEKIKEIKEKTASFSQFFLNLLVAYDGYQEMLEAIEKIIELKKQKNDLVINKELVKSCLYTKNLPPVDFVIRTGGEPHLSAGCLMWDLGDSQFLFLEKYWPDFTEEDLYLALEDYQKRERRFGQ